jgi:hypothetical protein
VAWLSVHAARKAASVSAGVRSDGARTLHVPNGLQPFANGRDVTGPHGSGHDESAASRFIGQSPQDRAESAQTDASRVSSSAEGRPIEVLSGRERRTGHGLQTVGQVTGLVRAGLDKTAGGRFVERTRSDRARIRPDRRTANEFKSPLRHNSDRVSAGQRAFFGRVPAGRLSLVRLSVPRSHRRFRLGRLRLGSGEGSAVGCGFASVVSEDLPHGGGRDAVSESAEFAVDAPVTPGRVLGTEAQHESSELGWRGRPSCSGLWWLGPVAGHKATVPADDRGWLHDQYHASQPLPVEGTREDGQDRPVCRGEPGVRSI